jgi:hypothetical protein
MQTLIKITIAAMVLMALSPLSGGTATTPQPGGQFYDDDATVHEPSIEAIAAFGITRGCNPPTNTLFCPRREVSRAEMAAFLSRALELPAAPPAGFDDVETSIFSTDIDRLAAAGITRGCNPPTNTKFCPDDRVTRGQMAAFLTRALALPATDGASFVDDNASVFEPAIESLAAAGITLGCNPPDNDRFCPTDPVTRAEMATFLTRALRLETTAVAARPYLIGVMPRAAWGAEPAQGGFETHEINQITIHHSDDTGSASGPQLYRTWQDWHQYLGWPDLAYHLIVGVDGTVYEGRPMSAVGDTATEYDPTGHLLIVVEGDFDEDQPSAAQLESLAQLVAWASTNFDVPTVTGHRDHAATTCPGDHLYAEIDSGAIAGRAAAVVGEGGVMLTTAGGL